MSTEPVSECIKARLTSSVMGESVDLIEDHRNWSFIGPRGIVQENIAITSWKFTGFVRPFEKAHFIRRLLSCYRLQVVYMQRFMLLDVKASTLSEPIAKPWILERGCPMTFRLVVEDAEGLAKLKSELGDDATAEVELMLEGKTIGARPKYAGAHSCTVCGADAVCSREVEPRCASHANTEVSKLTQQVTAFHKAVDQPILPRPTVPSDARVRLRLRLITEEYFELLASCGIGDVDNDNSPQDNLISRLHADVLGCIEGADVSNMNQDQIIEGYEIKVDLPALADAMGDLDYVVEGTRLEFGINGAPVADAIHAANLKKASGPVRADGKRLKPPGFTPPDIAGELRKQGWDG